MIETCYASEQPHFVNWSAEILMDKRERAIAIHESTREMQCCACFRETSPLPAPFPAIEKQH